MKDSLFNKVLNPTRVFIVTLWHSVTSHAIEDADMFRYKQTTRPEFAKQVKYAYNIQAGDKRVLADFIQEYKILGHILDPGTTREELGV